MRKAVELAASEILNLREPAPRHLDLMALDADSKELFYSPLIETVVSMDASRVGLNDTDIIYLAEGNG